MTYYLNNTIKKRILKKNVISFDIFDTLINRNCLNPSDIFDFVEIKYNKLSNKKISNFKSIRKKAASIAKEKNSVEEATFDQIYECINKKYDVELLKELEIQAELDFCVANKEMKEIYDFAVKSKKRIICVSDMYFNSNMLKRILNKCGYEIDEIYVSSEFNMKKRTNKLFKELLRENKFERNEIIHFGDSKKGDYLYPKLLGISTILIRSNIKTNYINNKVLDLSTLNNNIIFSLSKNNVESNIYYNFGYEVIGPVCLYFLIWLKNKCFDKKYKLLFCARDMKMIYEMYNVLFPNESKRTNYFYVSRRSLRLPFLYKYNYYDSIINTLADHKLRIVDILDNFNLLTNDIILKMKELNIFGSKTFDKKSLSNYENQFYYLYEKILRTEIDKLGKTEYNCFVNYLNSLTTKDFYLIDMGWKGTTQKMLMDLFPERKIKGAYFGVETQSKYSEINHMSSDGYMFFKNNEYINDIQTKIYSSEVLFEKVFSAQHQSTIKYNDINPYYVFEDKQVLLDDKISVLQEGAFKFITDIKVYLDYLEEKNSFEFVDILIDNLTSPNLTFAKFFGEIINDNMYKRKMASPKSIWYYIFHIKHLKRDISESGWKIGFMKRLFKIRLPYYYIYKIAYERKKRSK